MLQTPREIALQWQRKGLYTLKNGLPAHPEFVYRLSGEWQGWSQFLGTQRGTPEFMKNAEVDTVESEAYRLFHKLSL